MDYLLINFQIRNYFEIMKIYLYYKVSVKTFFNIFVYFVH